MYSRTYDAQRFSPLRQITRQNVGQLQEVFKKELGAGTHRGHPDRLSRRDVLLTAGRGGAGARRHHRRADLGAPAADRRVARQDARHLRGHGLSTPSPDGFIVALDARTGEVRWETKTTGGMTAGSIVVEGKVLTGRTCAPRRENCYIAAHDAKTGAELWRFYTAAGVERAGRRHLGRRARRDARRVHVGAARRLRPGAAAGLLGRRQPDAQHARRSARRQLRRHPGCSRRPICTATRPSRCTSDTGKLALVLPAPARRRLGRGLPARAHAAAHRRAPGPEVREVDQPRRASRGETARRSR